MPVIRDEPIRLPAGRHEQLVEELKNTLENPQNVSLSGPVIFEIPFTGDLYDVMVVWKQWEGVHPDERTAIISEAYLACHRVEIAQASGVTFDEAAQDQLLPWEVHPRVPRTEALFKAMMEEGAIAKDEKDERICFLRFPTQRMAETARERLNKKMPEGRWLMASLERLPSYSEQD